LRSSDVSLVIILSLFNKCISSIFPSIIVDIVPDKDRKYKEIRVKEWLRHGPKKIEAEQKRKANLDQMENSNEENNETAETDSD